MFVFCKNIIGDENMYNQVDRHGDEVKVQKCTSDLNLFKEALDIKKQYNSVAIVTKTQSEAEQLRLSLESSAVKSQAFKVINGKDKIFNPDKILIIPSYLAKGLEFDAVIISDASENVYPVEHKNLLYVACTRALHKLCVYYKSNITPLLKNAK